MISQLSGIERADVWLWLIAWVIRMASSNTSNDEDEIENAVIVEYL